MNSTTQRATVLALLVALMATRLHLPATVTHFGALPDASWAVFFIGGYYLLGWGRGAFPALMGLAVFIDYLVIRSQGIDFWTHYCMSAAYWFLVPAYLAMWAGGALLRRHQGQADGHALGLLVATLFGAVVACHLLSQGSFYWLSDVVAQPTLAGWWKNYSDWFLPFLRVAAVYTALALVVHVLVIQARRLAGRSGATR